LTWLAAHEATRSCFYAELSFGEKLLIARKQLDLYQYEMAERLGVHPNSLTKYERGEGKPHAAVVRMFEILCEKHGIRFDEYEAAQKGKGDAMKIVLAEKVSPATLAVFAAEPGWEVLTHDQLPEGLPAALADADALVVRSAVQVDDALMEHAPKLRVIGRAGVGVDNIDAEAATRRGIVVMNTPGANAVAVAELTIGLMLALARKLPAANSTMHAGKWEKKSLQGAELRGKTLGILGLGRIGLEVAKRAKGFGLEIIGSDPFVSAAVARENGIKLVTLEELIAGSDYLTLHVGLTPQTTGVINAKTLAAMKKGVRIINCARGELIDDAALVEALKSGQVAGAALDVFAKSRQGLALCGAGQRDSDAAHRRLDGRGAGGGGHSDCAPGARLSQAGRGAECGESALAEPRGVRGAGAVHRPGRAAGRVSGAGGQGRHRGHRPGLRRLAGRGQDRAGAQRGHRRAAARLGECEPHQRGGGGRGARHPHSRGEGGEPSRRRGQRADHRAAHGGKGSSRASATVIHGEQPRLLEFDGIDIETPLEGNLLVCRNLDVPGVIGKIGTILGEHGVNIANFALGRERSGPKPVKALAVVQVDAPVSDSGAGGAGDHRGAAGRGGVLKAACGGANCSLFVR
jgi:D-3-phosphoglycerate dehydrogenase